MNPATIMAWFVLLFPIIALIISFFKEEHTYRVYKYCSHGTHYTVQCEHCDNRAPIEREKK